MTKLSTLAHIIPPTLAYFQNFPNNIPKISPTIPLISPLPPTIRVSRVFGSLTPKNIFIDVNRLVGCKKSEMFQLATVILQRNGTQN